MSKHTKPPVAPRALSEADKQAAQHALRAILETLWRLSGTVETMARATAGDDIDPPGLFNILRDAGQDSFSVGADAVDKLEELLGVDVGADEGEEDPFRDAYRDFRRQVAAPATNTGERTL